MNPICDVCGLPVDRTGNFQRRHPGACHREHERRRAAAGRTDGRHADRRIPSGPWRGERTCSYCGETFEAKSPRATVCYADRCQKRKHADRMRPVVARRKAQSLGTRTEAFDHRDVFERDAWACGLCGDPIDPWLRWPHHRSASLDHVVPLARGGAHTLENVQAAHLSCNASKGARYGG